jgi:hypothetical protein
MFFDRSVVRFDGTYGDYAFRVAPDLKGIDTRGGFDEAWLAWKPSPLLRLSAGLIEVPLSIEHSIVEEDLPLPGYSFLAQIDARTDLTLRLEGEIEDGLFSWELAASAGEGFDRAGNRSAGPQASGRVVLFPFRWHDWNFELGRYRLPLLSGLFVSGAAAYAGHVSRRLEISTPARNVLFSTFSRVEAEESFFVHFGGGAAWGPVLIFHEFVRGGWQNVETASGDVDIDNDTHSWTLHEGPVPP